VTQVAEDTKKAGEGKKAIKRTVIKTRYKSKKKRSSKGLGPLYAEGILAKILGRGSIEKKREVGGGKKSEKRPWGKHVERNAWP